jgi:hypothetical protein
MYLGESRKDLDGNNFVADELIEILSKENYILSSEQARLEYIVVVLREYRKFFEKNEQSKALNPPG